MTGAIHVFPANLQGPRRVPNEQILDYELFYCPDLRNTRKRHPGPRACQFVSETLERYNVEELTLELREILNANVQHRLRAHEEFKDIRLKIGHILFKTKYDGLKKKESCEVNSKGLEIFKKSCLPETQSSDLLPPWLW
ncbi:hypothetical protein L1987_40006 [Smallanthus sonchifolius]|uniref:Uncharacterized protein n=1 Tax=Smallanthus sonchifolius TaxID=185202 RepID=A0ACB9GSA9_9ASTR|nr:hypothetical protein L1987_40006 [Smallanthus sonchifolius]